ncbi:hypothetical protein F4775DRAFT_536733 [Biscogniauxia sp. FL1348]|nr:hypothetical protein F4775DRAFT_536733 [Biscogniauxia sp. FL1348]
MSTTISTPGGFFLFNVYLGLYRAVCTYLRLGIYLWVLCSRLSSLSFVSSIIHHPSIPLCFCLYLCLSLSLLSINICLPGYLPCLALHDDARSVDILSVLRRKSISPAAHPSHR